MKKPMNLCVALLLTIIVSGVPMIARADVNTTSFGRITFLTSGWAANTMRVTTTAPFFNPEGCANFDGYITDPADSGTPLYHSILLQAFQAQKQVSLIISGCFAGRAKIIGVTVLP